MCHSSRGKSKFIGIYCRKEGLRVSKRGFDLATILGDDGLKRLFKKIYKLLNDEGMFILEPQPYHGYKRRKNLTVSDGDLGFSKKSLYPSFVLEARLAC